MTVIPTYGRDYKSAKAAREAWESNKDFQISDISSRYNGAYTSIRDNHPTVTIRFNKLTKATTILGEG